MKIPQYISEEEQDKKFDSDMVYAIIEGAKGNPYQAIKEYEDYLKLYPFDYLCATYYISTLIKVRELEKAHEELKYTVFAYTRELNNIERKMRNKELTHLEYRNAIGLLKRVWKEIVYNRFKLLCYESRYDDALLFYNQHKEILDNIPYVALHLECILSETADLPEGKSDYTARQILKFSTQYTKAHIEIRQSYQGVGKNKDTIPFFFRGFPVDAVIDKVQELLPTLNELYLDYIDDTYIFRCENCGIAEGETVDYFKALTFHGTNNICSIAPIKGFEYIPGCYDFTEFVKENQNKSKV